MVDKYILNIVKDIYGLSGTERLLVRSGLLLIEENLKRPLDPILDSDIIEHYLAEIGVSGAREDLYKVTKKYGEQLIWEGKEFNSEGKSKSGNSIIRRLLLNSRGRKEGD